MYRNAEWLPARPALPRLPTLPGAGRPPETSPAGRGRPTRDPSATICQSSDGWRSHPAIRSPPRTGRTPTARCPRPGRVPARSIRRRPRDGRSDLGCAGPISAGTAGLIGQGSTPRRVTRPRRSRPGTVSASTACPAVREWSAGRDCATTKFGQVTDPCPFEWSCSPPLLLLGPPRRDPLP